MTVASATIVRIYSIVLCTYNIVNMGGRKKTRKLQIYVQNKNVKKIWRQGGKNKTIRKINDNSYIIGLGVFVLFCFLCIFSVFYFFFF